MARCLEAFAGVHLSSVMFKNGVLKTRFCVGVGELTVLYCTDGTYKKTPGEGRKRFRCFSLHVHMVSTVMCPVHVNKPVGRTVASCEHATPCIRLTAAAWLYFGEEVVDLEPIFH